MELIKTGPYFTEKKYEVYIQKFLQNIPNTDSEVTMFAIALFRLSSPTRHCQLNAEASIAIALSERGRWKEALAIRLLAEPLEDTSELVYRIGCLKQFLAEEGNSWRFAIEYGNVEKTFYEPKKELVRMTEAETLRALKEVQRVPFERRPFVYVACDFCTDTKETVLIEDREVIVQPFLDDLCRLPCGHFVCDPCLSHGQFDDNVCVFDACLVGFVRDDLQSSRCCWKFK